MYITNKELCTDWGGKDTEIERVKHREKMLRLPYNYCNISMTPFKDPYCTSDGVVYDLLNIVPYLRKHNKNPMTGEPMKQSDLIKLNFHKNDKGDYHCPITFKQFSEFTHIIAVKETGNVYTYDAFKELNKEPQWYYDLLTNEKFDPKKLLTIQDPKSPGRRQALYDFKQEKPKQKQEKINMTGTQKRIFD